MLGFTWKEVTSNFDRNIAAFANNQGLPKKNILDKLPHLYGLYSFSQKVKTGLLVPGSVCECLENEKLKSYLPSAPAFEHVVDQSAEYYRGRIQV